MVRSLYSGVSGLRSHQTRMDTIGNNIANVNTSGFKSSRVTFRDIYYQTTKSPSAGTDFSGGVNPSQIGYGTQVASVDTNMSRSSFQMTESGLDFAIAGDGFFQIQDAAGNLMYTRAGNLNLDPKGNLVDSKGNFVLGAPIFTDASGNITGQDAGPSSNRLTLKIPDSIDKASASIKELLGTEVKLNLSKIGPDGNMTVSFQQVSGQSPYAVMNGNSVAIYLDLNKQFTNQQQLQDEINKAITNSNIPLTHPIRADGGLVLDATPPAGGETATLSTGSITAVISEILPAAAKSAKGSATFGTVSITATGTTIQNAAANGIQINFATAAPGTGIPNAVWAGNTVTVTLDNAVNNYTAAVIETLIGGAITPPVAYAGTVLSPANALIDATQAASFPKTIVLTGGAAAVPARARSEFAVTMNSTAPGAASNAYKTVFTKGTTLDTTAAWNGNTLMVSLGTGDDQATKVAIDAAIAAAAGTGPDAPAKRLTISADIATDNTTPAEIAKREAAIEYSKNGVYMNGGKNTFFTDVAKLLGVTKLEGGSYAGPQSTADITNLAVGKDGIIVATHPVFGELVLGRIDLAVFDNQNGLEQLGDSYFGQTVNSGDVKLMSPDSQAAGALVSNALESSNVDLSKEFSDMIVTQRGFQANSRIITVSDEMLQELVNLKR